MTANSKDKIDLKDIAKIKRFFSVKDTKVDKKDMVVSTVTFSVKFREHITIFSKENNYRSLQAAMEHAIKKLMQDKNYQYEE
jgi:hypothetical protein